MNRNTYIQHELQNEIADLEEEIIYLQADLVNTRTYLEESEKRNAELRTEVQRLRSALRSII